MRKLNIMEFDYGDLVRVDSADQNHVQKTGSVVGITLVETEEQVLLFGRPKGTFLYTVEFGDGADALIAESNLIRLEG